MQALAALSAALGAAAGLACSSVEQAEGVREHRVSSADGVEIAYEDSGFGSPTLVFIHGWCGERSLWRSTIEALSHRWRCISLDLGGHGASGTGRESWTLAALAEDVVAVVRDANAGAVILVGHSMGGPVALLATPRLAPFVRGVIGVDSLHDADFAYPPGFLEEVAAGLEADFPRALEASFRGVTGPQAPAELVDWIFARAMRTDRGAAVALLRGLEGFDLRSALEHVGAPVRVVNAAPGTGAGIATSVARNRELCDFDARFVEDSGHFPMLEQPAAFQAALRRWIEELSAPRSTPAR